MNELPALLADAAFWAAVLALAAPLVLGTTGALLCGRAGILQFGSEGVVMLGALLGLMAAQHAVEPWIGLLAASGAGLLVGVLQGVLLARTGVSPALLGLALTLIGIAIAQTAWPGAHAPATMFRPIDLSSLSGFHAAEAALRQPAPVYLAVLLAAIVAYVLARTPLGLAIRACGENPRAVEVQGRSVSGLRTGTLMAGSAMLAAAGAVITLTASSFVPPEAVTGQGFLCLALAAAAGWRPGLAFAGALVFGAIDAVVVRLAQDFGLRVPLMATAPYLLAIVALAVTSRRLRWPGALSARADGGSA